MIRWDVRVKRFDIVDLKCRIFEGTSWSLVLYEFSV